MLAVGAALMGLLFAGAGSLPLKSQPAAQPAAAGQSAPLGLESVPLTEPSEIALPIAEDRGQAAVEQALTRLSTTASVMMIVAHPDDEDGALLTWLKRRMGVRTILLTLTRGEGGQNAMSGEVNDALGILRTHELLKAGEYYGVKQLWGTEADFGFCKTQEEAFSLWGHERVLYDAVLAVRRERPQVIVSTFVGGITDGHGHHQVSGEIAQEIFKAAAEPAVFPDQLKDGLAPWQPLAVYSMVPFAPITEKGMFDYATGKWAPAKFKNYVTGEWTTGALSTDVTIPVGAWDPVLGRSYVQIAREGWGLQKSQNGGGNPTLAGPANTSYHLWAVAPQAKATGNATGGDLFHNGKVEIDTSIAGLARLAGSGAPQWLAEGLARIQDELAESAAARQGRTGTQAAHQLAPAYRETLRLREQVAASALGAAAKSGLLKELDAKIEDFQAALRPMLGLDIMAFTARASQASAGFAARGASADEMPRSIAPGEEFRVRVHLSQATGETRLNKVWLASRSGDEWKSSAATAAIDAAAPAGDQTFTVKAADNAEPTKQFFTRQTAYQPTYDIERPEWRGRSFAPYPLQAWAEFTFDGVPIRVGQIVQTMARAVGQGGTYEPLVVAPRIGVRIDPMARILPLDGSALPVKVTVHSEGRAEGTVELKLPAGWRAEPAEAAFKRDTAGDTEPILFSVTPTPDHSAAYSVEAVAHSAGKTYSTGWQRVGYPGLLPYNQYLPARLSTRRVDMKLAPGLKVGYLMGPGDSIPEALEGMGLPVHVLTPAELAQGDLSAWNVILVGIRAYSTRPELGANQARLNEFVSRGGTLIVEYQSGGFPAPLPLALSSRPEEVVDEAAPVKLLEPQHPLLQWPNVLTPSDFDGWVEERGHSFVDTWDPGYTALTETADAGQDPQRGGLLIAHPGKGTYIYCAYALHRQLPELVPGAYRLLANLLSAGMASGAGKN